MPVSDRLAHKNWKARVSAYETLVKTFQNTASDTDPAFKPYTNNPDLLKKIATDSNAVAQEKAVECLVAYVKFAGEIAAKTREAVLPALVDKCYGSSRAGTKAHALELTLRYVEVENGGAGVVVSCPQLRKYTIFLRQHSVIGRHSSGPQCQATQNCRRLCGCSQGNYQVGIFASKLGHFSTTISSDYSVSRPLRRL